MKLEYKNCLLCDYEGVSNYAVNIHVSTKHKMSKKTYYLLYYRPKDENCFCEVCGNITNLNVDGTWTRFCGSHCANKVTTTVRHEKESIFNKEKMEQTNLEVHGEKHYTNRKKYKETCKKQWNSENIFNSKPFLIKNIFKLKKKLLSNLNKKLPFGYCMNYNHKTHIIHYHCNLCNKNFTCKMRKLFSRVGRNQNPCIYCFKKSTFTSAGERELGKYIKCIYKHNVIFNDRSTIHKEIDVYLPDLKLGFEFDGTYWHMDKRFHKATDINKHKNKTADQIWKIDELKDKLAANKGIKIIHIKQFDWESNKVQEQTKIMNIINEHIKNYYI